MTVASADNAVLARRSRRLPLLHPVDSHCMNQGHKKWWEALFMLVYGADWHSPCECSCPSVQDGDCWQCRKFGLDTARKEGPLLAS